MTQSEKKCLKFKISRLKGLRDDIEEALLDLQRRRDDLLARGHRREDFFVFDVNAAGLRVRLRQDAAELKALENALDVAAKLF